MSLFFMLVVAIVAGAAIFSVVALTKDWIDDKLNEMLERYENAAKALFYYIKDGLENCTAITWEDMEKLEEFERMRMENGATVMCGAIDKDGKIIESSLELIKDLNNGLPEVISLFDEEGMVVRNKI